MFLAALWAWKPSPREDVGLGKWWRKAPKQCWREGWVRGWVRQEWLSCSVCPECGLQAPAVQRHKD